MKHLANQQCIRHLPNYCKTTFLSLPRPTSIIFNRPVVVGKTILLRQKPQSTHYYHRIATKLAKAYQYLLLQLQ